jgi:hypothetical protein
MTITRPTAPAPAISGATSLEEFCLCLGREFRDCGHARRGDRRAALRDQPSMTLELP